MAGGNLDLARELFKVPGDYIFGAAMALGYLGEPAALPNQQMQGPGNRTAQRKPLSEFVLSAWGTPAGFD